MEAKLPANETAKKLAAAVDDCARRESSGHPRPMKARGQNPILSLAEKGENFDQEQEAH
jgi:hypothetical protein